MTAKADSPHAVDQMTGTPVHQSTDRRHARDRTEEKMNLNRSQLVRTPDRVPGKVPDRALGKIATCLALFALATAAPLTALAEEPKGDPTYNGSQPIDRELDKYWNVEQKVSSLQNPMYERKGGFEAALHFGVVPNDSFYFPKSIGGNLGYFLTDTVAIELGFSYLMNANSDLQAFLVAVPGGKNGPTDLTKGAKKAPEMNWMSSADLAWSPFHGKLGIFDAKLSNFDLGVVAGVGIIGANVDTSQDGDTPPVSAIKVGGHWGASLRFYLTRWLNIRADYRQFLYKPDADKSFLAPVEFTLGLAFLTK